MSEVYPTGRGVPIQTPGHLYRLVNNGSLVRMRAEQLREAHGARPFKPFTIRMTNGRSVPIPHPEFLSVSPTGRVIVIYDKDGDANILDLVHVTELDMSRRANAQKRSRNGHG
jgi:hypothetical protein